MDIDGLLLIAILSGVVGGIVGSVIGACIKFFNFIKEVKRHWVINEK